MAAFQGPAAFEVLSCLFVGPVNLKDTEQIVISYMVICSSVSLHPHGVLEASL